MERFMIIMMVLIMIGMTLFVLAGGIAALVAVARWIG